MANPTPRRKPATDLEMRLSAGDAVDPKEVIDAIDQPMHDELVKSFRSALSADEREELARDVLVKLLEAPQKYDCNLASLPRFAKIAVRNRALDYFKERRKNRKQQNNFVDHGYLTLAPAEAPGPLQCAEQAAAYAAAVQTVMVAIMDLPPDQRLAAEAYRQHGPKNYASILAAELGVSPNLVAQWWRRAKATILKSVGKKIRIFE
jgi:RNA polymerase sigma factor (sigma-70 family)